MADPITENPTPTPQPIIDDAAERFRKEAERVAKERDDLAAELKAEKDKKLKERQDYKQLFENTEKERDQYKTKFEGLSSALVQEKKLAALTSEAVKQGIINTEDLELVDFSEVGVETTSTGKIIVQGADLAIKNLKAKRPNWFKANPEQINPGSPEVIQNNSGSVNIDELMLLEKEYRKNLNDQVAKKKYEEALLKFKQKK